MLRYSRAVHGARTSTRIPTRQLGVRTMVDLARARASWNGRLVLSEEVEHALQTFAPIIALESTIITHGMPYPTNLSTCLSLESILREKGVIPATIALMDGKVHVGLTQSQLERLAEVDSGEERMKISRRDIAPALAKGVLGGTTVAGTMFVGSSLGIGCFVTGGIGGVHRGAESSMDVSADLIELGRTPMAVICAGAKSILDIPRTLEVLETQGVCVATYGDKPDFPAFYTPSSGMKSPWTVDNPVSAAELIHCGLSLPRPLSTLLAVPIPSLHTEQGETVQKAVEQAVRESVEQKIDRRGKEVTPWLLKRVGELTGGIALELNVKLIENNASVGASIAVELARLRCEQSTSHASSSVPYIPASTSVPSKTSPARSLDHTSTQPVPAPSAIVIGAAALDLTSQTPLPLSPRSTTPGEIILTPGGVGRNIAEAAQNLLPPNSVQLISVLGSNDGEVDATGSMLLLEMAKAGLRTDGLVSKEGYRSAACSLVLEKDGDLAVGVADMDIIEGINVSAIQLRKGRGPQIVAFDLNPSTSVIRQILEISTAAGIPTLCDPTSVPKLSRLIAALIHLLPSEPTASRPLSHFSPNLIELSAFHTALTSDLIPDKKSESAWAYINSLNLTADFRAKLDVWLSKQGRDWIKSEGVVQQMIACLPYVDSFWVKAGKNGLIHLGLVPEQGIEEVEGGLYYRLEGPRTGTVLKIVYYPALRIAEDDIVSTTGAGDTLVGGIVAGLLSGKLESKWITDALEGVGRTMRSCRAVG